MLFLLCKTFCTIRVIRNISFSVLFVPDLQSTHLISVGSQLKFAPQPLRCPAAHQHTLQKDFKIVHHIADGVIQLQRHVNHFLLFIHLQFRCQRRVIHAVMDIKLRFAALLHLFLRTSVLSARISAADTASTAFPVASS